MIKRIQLCEDLEGVRKKGSSVCKGHELVKSLMYLRDFCCFHDSSPSSYSVCLKGSWNDPWTYTPFPTTPSFILFLTVKTNISMNGTLKSLSSAGIYGWKSQIKSVVSFFPFLMFHVSWCFEDFLSQIYVFHF